MSSELENFSVNTALLRKSKGWTQSDLGKKVGVKPNSISNWEKGVSFPQFSDFVKLIKAFGVSANEMLEPPTTKVKLESSLYVRERLLGPQRAAEAALAAEPQEPYGLSAIIEQRFTELESRLAALEMLHRTRSASARKL